MSYPEGREPGNNFFDILDNNNKIIVRISRPSTTYPNIAIKANSTTIATGNQNTLAYKPLPLSISISESVITVNYGSYTAVTTGGFDASADITKPKTIQFSSNSSPAAYQITISNLRLYTNVSTITTTPDAPTLMANDVANTLSAAYPLGDSVILVSENGGPFADYTGPIDVGNVARAAGYWKFNIKASTLRNDSAVVSSPEFTAITTPDSSTLVADDVANTLQSIQSVTLVNAETATDISTIAQGATINLSALASRNLTIRANTSAGILGSVVFNLSGAQTKTQSESVAPYALFGDVNGVYNAWTPVVGSYTLVVTPYSGPGETGIAGTPSTFTFTVVDNAVIPTNTTPTAATLSFNTGTSTVISAATLTSPTLQKELIEFSIYPNPIIGNNISIQSSVIAKGAYNLLLVNSMEQLIFRTSINHNGGAFKYSIPLSPTLPHGIYILHLSGKDVKFTKQLLK